jgi:tRNA-specific 2-thiouridylase
LGEHQGLANYTIGQRKGLGLASAEPLYVLDKDISQNILVVGSASELGSGTLLAAQVNWIEKVDLGSPIRTEVKIRYKAQPAWATVTPLPENAVLVQFDHNLRDITPGQACVFYAGDTVLGGGVIQRAIPQTQKEQL